MGASEIAYRFRQALQTRLELYGYGSISPTTTTNDKYGAACWSKTARDFDVDLYVDSANRILAGRFDVFSLQNLKLGFPPSWNRDPKTGTNAPMVFGKLLNYRDQRLVGNIKYLWEPNRHLELVTIAQAWNLTRDIRYVDGCRQLLDSWFEQCPYPLGPNWVSSLEHGIRLVNWAVAWQLLGSEESPLFAGQKGKAFLRRWQDAVYYHCRFIAGHLSRYSSANNHLLGELMGLFIATLTWPLWSESERWLELARLEFQIEVLKQNSIDGVNREQAVWYHHEVADMMLLCGLIGKSNGVEFDQEYWNRLEDMLGFVAAIMDLEGHVPMIGDADDAVIVRFSREVDFNPFRSLLATGALIFKREDFAIKAGHFDDKSRWLLGDNCAGEFEQLSAATAYSTSPRQSFSEGGYWVVGSDFDTNSEIRLVADAGPIGYLSIAAHGHADALAFTLSVAGQEVLIDPGTFAYHTQKKWRDYFRGTSAHNTVRVDGLDQSVIGGNFMWHKHATVRCVDWHPGETLDYWVGEHDGYRRLSDPVVHRRELLFDKRENQVEVIDTLKCENHHEVEVYWHTAEACKVEMNNNKICVNNGSSVLTMSMSSASLRPEIVHARETPTPLGWISRSFDEKFPITTIVWRGSINGTTKLVSVLRIEISSKIDKV